MNRAPSVWQGSLRELELLDCLQYVRNCVRTLAEYCRSQWGEEDVPHNVARHALVEIDRAPAWSSLFRSFARSCREAAGEGQP